MKESIKKNKKLIIIGIAIILILLIGVAFVYLTTTLYGEKEYLVRAGSLGLKLEEGNELVLEKVIPLEDSEGQSLNGFNFSLVNEGGVVLDNLGQNGSTYDDGVDTFITGTDPNNYIWYSGKLWRAVSVDNETKTTKLVTQWNISTVNYDDDSSAFEGSYMEEWLNDTSVDGFLGNLREPEKFIVMDAKWDATIDTTNLGSITRPDGEATVTDAIGLLNMYEYQSSYHSTTYGNGYLNNGLWWYTLTPNSMSDVRCVTHLGNNGIFSSVRALGVRPSINLKSNVKIVDGDGTIDNPYRLDGDNDTNLSGTKLSNRYSGEYIRFGTGENTLYRIVSHENGTGTKITSAEPLKSSETFITSAFGSNTTFSSTNTIGMFLNGDYLTSYVGDDYANMIEDSTTWYLGTVGSGASYKLAKYTDTNMSSITGTTTNAKVGLLRYGERPRPALFIRQQTQRKRKRYLPFYPIAGRRRKDIHRGLKETRVRIFFRPSRR